jgi:outer membrane protein assembly factor BamE (lipoprotein component of BamABCDE complex)
LELLNISLKSPIWYRICFIELKNYPKGKEDKMLRKKLVGGFGFLIFLLLSGCMTVAQHQRELHSTQEREMTVGIVQKEICVGMSQADVTTALGSPNIITRDSKGNETWIYDKIATEASFSRDSGGLGGGTGAGGMAGSVLILGLLGGIYYKEAGAASTTQKTLTVIIRFDKNGNVESFAYHASKF